MWRTVVLATTQKSQAEVFRLEDSILMPDRARSANDIEKALVDWDALYREYTEAGGGALSDHRKVGVLMRLLPTVLHDDILKEFGRFDSKPDDLRRWIRDRVQWLKWSDTPGRKHHFLDGGEEAATERQTKGTRQRPGSTTDRQPRSNAQVHRVLGRRRLHPLAPIRTKTDAVESRHRAAQPQRLGDGEILGSAFAKLRQLEASESPDCTETETPPVPTAKRTKNEKRQLRFCECACPGA